MKLPIAPSGRTLICSIVIALTTTTVIQTVLCTSISADAPAASPAAIESPKGDKIDASSKPSAKSAAPLPEVSKSSPAANQEAASSRQARSEPPPLPSDKASAPAAATTTVPPPTTTQASSSSDKASSKPVAGAGKPSSSATGGKQQQLSGKSGASGQNKKLPANLGTVTSTGSGGPAHYMSKHDAYSAIAEKHGALAQDAMRKADKRQHLQRFSGIQKAGGFGDMLSPFRGVTDSGLARTLGASVRSIIKGKFSVPAYLASAALGAVALLAFYESPMSPLPVPSLPEPPVGRFPPEMPVISPNLQVPFRLNQQQQQQYGQNYANQRSFQAGPSGSQPSSGQQQQSQPQQQQQQVLFPGATAQQRQMNAAGPVQQLAANIISSVGANRQNAQRKSSPDYDPSSSRSFFGSSSPSSSLSQANAKLSSPANQHHHAGSHKQTGSSLLSFFGLGGGASSGSGGDNGSPVSSLANLDVHRASGLGGHQIAAGGGPVSSASGTEIKGQAALSNSHIINKMKSYFDRPIGHTIWSAEQYAPNQYDQYRRMSIVQALAKDTAFLSSFFTPARRSSNSTTPSVNQLQQSISNILSAAVPQAQNAAQNVQQQQAAAARMQVDNVQPLFSYAVNPLHNQNQNQQQASTPIVNTKRASSGYGLMRTADRIAHALLDTFSSGLLHRSSSAHQQADSMAARKSEEQQQQNALASATSLLSDMLTSYNAASAAVEQSKQQQQQQQHVSALEAGKQQQQLSGAASSETGASARSSEQVASPVQAEQQQVAPASSSSANSNPKSTSQQSSAIPDGGSAAAEASASGSQQAAHVRKTRSIGLDYPTTEYQMYQQQLPSRAAQINNFVDMVSDSYKQNKLLFNFVMNQVGLSHALPYVEQILGSPNEHNQQYN